MGEAQKPPRKFSEECKERCEGFEGRESSDTRWGDVGDAYLVGAGDTLAMGQHQKLRLKVWVNSGDPTKKKKKG